MNSMKPDVVIMNANQTNVFRSQTKRASEWLHEHCQLAVTNRNGHTEFRVHPTQSKHITEKLRAAGFDVAHL